MKKLICALVLATAANLGLAQTKDDGQELIDKFFEVYKTKGYALAMRYAFGTNQWISPVGDEMDGVIVRLYKEVSTMGDFLGHEEIRSRTVGSRFRICTYFVYYQRDPMRFLFELYKTDKGWEITNVDFDRNFEAELEESMKLTDK